VLVDLYGPRTSSSSGSSGQAAQTLDSWKAGITTTRRTKTVQQKWQELLLSVAGEVGGGVAACDVSNVLLLLSVAGEVGGGG
jgi:hypothetical protein